MLDIYRKQAEGLAHLTLDELLELESQFEIEVEKTNKEAERLEKKLRVIKQELKEYREASKKLQRNFEETPLYQHLVEFLDNTEEFLKNVKIKNGELISYLYAITKKIKEEKRKHETWRFKGE
jgi:phosphoenolpyruvate-protein kinase (PTS system EI component)